VGVHVVVAALVADLKPQAAQCNLQARRGLGPGALVGQHHGLAHAVHGEAHQRLPLGQADALQQVVAAGVKSRRRIGACVARPHGTEHPHQQRVDVIGLGEVVHADGRGPERH
jgi:thiamine monophosphate synthase